MPITNRVQIITETDRSDFRGTVRYAFVATPYCEAVEAWCDEGLCYLGLCVNGREQTLADMRRRFCGASFVEIRFTEDYDSAAAVGRICLVGTPFRRAVWRELLKVECGERISYGELARRVGRPSGMGARAVGQAVGANPIGLIVPCHRIVGADGSMHGYYWGTAIKRQILDSESRRATRQDQTGNR